MADQLATPTALIIRLNYPDDTQATDRATAAVEHATARIQSATRQKLVQVLNETVTLPNSYGSSLWLPERPVTAVGAVTTTDEYGAVTARALNTDYYLIGAQLRWYRWVDSVKTTVTYSHGYAANAIPKDLEDECLRIAAVLYENPRALQSETVGGVSQTFGSEDASREYAVSPHIITAYSLLAVA